MRRFFWLLLLLLMVAPEHTSAAVSKLNGFSLGAGAGNLAKIDGLTVGNAAGNYDYWNSIAVPLGIQAETAAQITRITNDGGTIVSVAAMDAAIYHAKVNNYYSDIVFLGSPAFAVKLESGTVVNSTVKMYDMGPTNHDSLGSASSPHNRSVWLANQQNGLPMLQFARSPWVQWLDFGNNWISQWNTQTWVIIFSKGTVSGASSVFNASDSGGDVQMGLMFDPSQGLWFADTQSSDNFTLSTYAALPSPVFLISVLDANRVERHYINGGSVINHTGQAAYSNAWGQVYLGLAQNNVKPWDGKVGLVLVTKTAMSDTIRNAVRVYYNGIWAIF